MDVPRLRALNQEWTDYPPARVSLARIARWLGAAPGDAPKAPARKMTAADVSELAKIMPAVQMPAEKRAAIRTQEDALRAAEDLFFGSVLRPNPQPLARSP